MNEFSGYDQMMEGYYVNMSNYSLPLLSWEFYGEVHEAMGIYRDDINTINKLSKNWVFDKDYQQELVNKKSVIIITDPSLTIIYASNNIEKLNGYLPEEVVGNSPKMFQGVDTCSETSASVRTSINNGIPFEVSLLNYKKDSSTYICEIKGYPILDKKGRLVNYIAFEKAA